MIKSMTAYARAETNRTDLKVSAEIRSYNSRHLDLSLRLPNAYGMLEERIKALIAGCIARGRVEVKIRIQDDGGGDRDFEINTARARSYYHCLNQLRATFDIHAEISLEVLMGAGDIIRPVESEADLEVVWDGVHSCLSTALDDLDDMRLREGAFIERDFQRRLGDIEHSLDEIQSASDSMVFQYQKRLLERIAALTEGITVVDEGRIAQEAAILADKSDISEEIVRAASHVDQFRRYMQAGEPAGRKLNFLLQEFMREFNTIGSKTGQAEVAHLVVAVKAELEKLREQVQNIE